MHTKPKCSFTDILVQTVGSELLIYDLAIDKAFSLNETCAMVWAECDGEKSIAEIASVLGRRTKGLVNEEVVWLALETLQRENLLTDTNIVQQNFNGLSRRQVIRKLGFATMVTIPMISSLVAPTAANAQSTPCSIVGSEPFTTPFTLSTSLCLGDSICLNACIDAGATLCCGGLGTIDTTIISSTRVEQCLLGTCLCRCS